MLTRSRRRVHNKFAAIGSWRRGYAERCHRCERLYSLGVIRLWLLVDGRRRRADGLELEPVIFPQLLENALSPNPGQGRSGLIATIPPATRRRKSWAKVSAPQEAPVFSMIACTTAEGSTSRPIGRSTSSVSPRPTTGASPLRPCASNLADEAAAAVTIVRTRLRRRTS